MDDGSENVFSMLDYFMFFFMLLLSVLIGVYFGFIEKKQDNPVDYLYGGKSMKVLPIAASLVASDVSGLTLLGLPADIYTYGTSFGISILSYMCTTIFIAHFFIPIFYKLQVQSCYEYLKMRYGNSVCVMCSGIFALTAILYMPIMVYIPALAFSQVSGINLYIIIPLVCLITIFYTTIGGIKAVVWADTLQMFVMIGSLITVFVMGVIFEGGFQNIWNKNMEGGRIDLNLSADPTSRTAIITVFIGTSTLWLSYGINPINIQRYLSVPSLADAKKTCYIALMGNNIIRGMAIFIGLIVFAHYQHCDPLRSGKIVKMDQIMPYYITSVAGYLPGLPGLFIAGIFCAALSTLSSALNTMSGTIYKDLVSSKLSPDITDKKASNIMKLIVVILGLVTMVMVYGVHYLGEVLKLALIVGGLTAGPLLATFLLGMLTPFVNLTGIISGSVCGIISVGWILFGAQYYALMGRIPSPVLPVSTDGCSFNVTNIMTLNTITNEPAPYIYRISFHYYSLIGFLTTSLIAIPISLLTGGHRQIINRDLLCSLYRRKSNPVVKVLEHPRELVRLKH